MDWSKQDDDSVTRELRRAANELDRMKKFKSGGIDSLPADLKLDVELLIKDLSGQGLFLVPVGELEQWLDPSKVSVSNQSKAAWANAAAAYIKQSGPENDSVWKFVRDVASFLKS